MAAPMPPPPAVKLSSVALTGIIVILVLMAAGVFAYVLFLAPLTTDQRLWWNGFVSIAFAFIAYLVYAGSEAKQIRSLAGVLFLIGAASFYGSIFVGTGDTLAKLVWSVILSILVVAVLAGIFVMSRQGEQTRIRMSGRRLTP
ncbi:MAG TPA: hypothetical protein VJ207_03635 [Thermoplasmata archaeon]|nr:hypothetical protein [Thermoplasmata archaeon]